MMFASIVCCCSIIFYVLLIRCFLIPIFLEEKAEQFQKREKVRGIYYGMYRQCYLTVTEEQDMLVQGKCKGDRQQLNLRKYKETKMWKIEAIPKMQIYSFQLVKLMYAPTNTYVRLDPLQEFGDFYADEKNLSMATSFAMQTDFKNKPTVLTVFQKNTILYVYFDQTYLTATQHISSHTQFYIQ
eukprot:TRINITY_DN1840_c0_g1_i2.p3 TRINITY_DN1840_c0_g1~~TRINITY_DN1840_c0_g1_i2.p3  ORF type:complete len:184 (-),score=20.47 TRINITY_DN1840_c0_g1_i2:986-1537(-)